MRIAILTSARSGSTSLYQIILQQLLLKKYFCMSEPFNRWWRAPAGLNTYDIDYFKDKQDVFIKTFVSSGQKPATFANDEEGYWQWFFNYFQKVIILDRKDKDLQSESVIYHYKTQDPYSWHKKQYYNLENITKQEIEETKKVLYRDSELMHSFAKNGYPLYYFEDLFIKKDKQQAQDLFDYIELPLLEDDYEEFINSDTCKIRLTKEEARFKSII